MHLGIIEERYPVIIGRCYQSNYESPAVGYSLTAQHALLMLIYDLRDLRVSLK